MVRFNSLSEGEKFAFSRDFLVKFKVIKKLRPELTEEKDILTLVAKKFYDEDMTNLEECIKFMDNKVKIESLSTINLDEPVKEFVFSYQQTKDFVEKLEDLLSFCLPSYVDEGKTNLVIAVGCTGGKHRSVCVAQAVGDFVAKRGYTTSVSHRDMARK